MAAVSDAYEYYVVDPTQALAERQDIEQLLLECCLDYEDGVEAFVVCRQEGKLVACAGIQQNVIKEVAIAPALRGSSLSLRLVSEVVYLAHSRNYNNLFVYTPPHNADFFLNCGFYSLVEVPDQATLLENTPIGIKSYCRELAAKRVEGHKVGCVVANANPFTLGHLYLVKEAVKECDWLHLFIVREDASYFSYRDRYKLAKEITKDIPKLTLHEGSDYMVSRATFPSYFFKDKGCIGHCRTAVDLLLFRQYIAPALGITHRFVGTEPFCETTRRYNADMKFWLQNPDGIGPTVVVNEMDRTKFSGVEISASEVRRALAQGDLKKIQKLVPPQSYDLIVSKYYKDKPEINDVQSQ